MLDSVPNSGFDVDTSGKFGKFVKTDSGPNQYAHNRPKDAPQSV